MKNKNFSLIRIKGNSVTNLDSYKSIVHALITKPIIIKNTWHWCVSTCADISVDKIRKNATFINKLIIYGERGSGEDADVDSS